MNHESRIMNYAKEKPKTPPRGRISSMDRGGVEPLERGDKSAPETLRTRPWSTKLIYQILSKEKSPLARALRRTKGIVHSGLVTRNAIISNPHAMSTPSCGKLKTPPRGRISSMDRGGVEPQKQTGKDAPDTDRTRPSRPQNDYTIRFRKNKEPTSVSPLESRAVSFTASLPVAYIISNPHAMSIPPCGKPKTPPRAEKRKTQK